MQRRPEIKGIDRIIDANINRLKEGLRVCEEVARFILNSLSLTQEFKKTRHRIDTVIRQGAGFKNLIAGRKSLEDTGRLIFINELKRRNYRDIFLANIQRAKESVRVLEEFSKLKDTRTAVKFKNIRYSIYEIEKNAVKRISSVCRHR